MKSLQHCAISVHHLAEKAVTEDVVNPLGVAAFLGSSSKKQGI
jgi:hypothetical protein